VVFYWREAEAGDNPPLPVPLKLTEELDEFHRCMQGTNKKRGAQCVALKGRIGEQAACTIYESRPTPCRAFAASYSEGKPNQRCDEARAAHGLEPLKPKDWV
jgi:hypothetical protein